MSEAKDAGHKPRVMFIAHSHPKIRPGGAEAYAFEIYEAMRDAGELDVMFVARSGPPFSIAERQHEGRPFTLVNEDPNQYLFYTDAQGHDWLYGRSPHKQALTRFFRDFLLDHRPDVVHVQHTMFLGYDMLRVIRNTLPDAPIVYTIHEFMPICHRDGQMLRTGTNEVCSHESPRRCHECFPDVSPETFFMRKRFIQSHLSLVDLFLAPSPGALELYVEWGIPRSRIVLEPHGRPSASMPADSDKRVHDSFGFFGQLTEYKGADVLLEAMSLLGEDFAGRLWIHGANLADAPDHFRERFGELIEGAHGHVRMVGQYEHRDLSKLMERIDWVVVPSIWRETGPLTLLEAFQRGRPVICSDIGGMAEKVTDGVNGLHFRRGNAHSLASAMRRAAETPKLWDQLRSGIPKVQTMDEHVARLSAHYRRLVEERRADRPGASTGKVLEHA